MSSVASKEATAVTQRLLDVLLTVPTATSDAADFRRAVGELRVSVQTQIEAATIGDDLATCFDLAFQAGGTVDRFDRVRQAAQAETPNGLSGQAMASAFVRLSLVYEAKALALVTFKSRQDVDVYVGRMNAAFEPAEEYAADRKETEVYRALVSLHAAVTRDLIMRSKPLPRLISYTFGRPFPSLRIAQRLYVDASRAEELRQEGKVPHPLFMPLSGRALSA